MLKIVRAYISTFRPSKFDGVPVEIYKPLRDRWAYGVKVFVDDRPSNIATSWVKSKEPMLPQITGLANLLQALDEFAEAPKIKIFTRSAHLDTRIRQVENRLRKKQQQKPVGELKNEELWEDATLHLQSYEHRGMREGIEEQEVLELSAIESALKTEFYSGSRFSSANAPEFRLILPDV